MRIVAVLLAAILLMSPAALAQEETKVEVGTTLGLTLAIPDDGDTEVFAGIPGGGTFVGQPSIYVTVFAGPSLMIEPQIYFIWNSAVEDALISGMIQVGYLLKPDAMASPYVAAHVGGLFITGDGSDSGAAGVAAGYRVGISEGAAFRVEGKYRRWLADNFDLNEVSFVLGLGVVL